jgi:hypothetical protein
LLIWNYWYFQRYYVYVKYIKCPLEWWRKHESIFPTIGSLIKQTLGVIVFKFKSQ